MIKIKTFDKEWKEQAVPYIKQSFDAFIPRSEFLKKSKNTNSDKLLSLEDERPNILEVTTSLADPTGKLQDFNEVFNDCAGIDYIREIMKQVEDYVAEQVVSAKATFVTFASDVTGATMGIRHLHPLMNGDRCNVWSFAIPLYVGENAPTFDIHQHDEIWPTRFMLDYNRIRKANLDYTSLTMPTDGSIFNMQFDGSRSPHVITYTDSVYMWFVFDGVEFKDGRDLRHTLTIGKV
jgi:hypothetical protein